MSQGPKILVVDDAQSIRLELMGILAEAGYNVLEASGGEMALTLLKEHQDIKFLIVDFNMPDMDGLELIDRSHKLDNFKDLRSAMITTESSKELKERAKALGVVVWILKPFDRKSVKMIFQKILPIT